MKNWKQRISNKNVASSDVERLEEITAFPEIPVDENTAWKRISSNISVKSEPNSLQYIWKIAAVIVIILAIGAIAYSLSSENMTRLQSGKHQKEWELPDGSYLFMDKYSEITFDEDFASNRELNLQQGRIYLEVTHNSLPFTVISEQLDVDVMGTSFSVDNEAQKVFVESGKVKVSSPDKTVYLTQGQSAVLLDKKELIKKEKKSLNDLSWKSRELRFSNAKLSEVIKELNAHYEVDINISEKIKDCSITANFKNQTVEEVMQVLSSILNLKVNLKKNRYYLSGSSC